LVRMGDQIKKYLLTFIRKQRGFESAKIMGLRKMPGGASKETWAFDLRLNNSKTNEVLPMILRIERNSSLPVSIDLKQEFCLTKEVYTHGIEVPKPYWYGEDMLGNHFCIVERIDGETIVRRLQRDDQYKKARNLVPAQLAKILANIHRIPVTKQRFDFLPWRSYKGSSALGELLFYEEVFLNYSKEPHPALELSLRWLEEKAPQSDHHVLVHGDFRLGNVIFAQDGVKSILDWELSHIGDPMEDVGYISVQAWRFGENSKPIGGVGSREDFYNSYEKAGGSPANYNTIKFWEIFGNLKWAIICILQAIPFVEGTDASIELASLGRKTAEVELQLLTLIDG
jgi:aminoglycoside phosphotransferase (APT) family kinase protein